MAATLQTFLNQISCLKVVIFKYHWNVFPMVQKNNNKNGQLLDGHRKGNIILDNYGLVYWSIYASIDLGEWTIVVYFLLILCFVGTQWVPTNSNESSHRKSCVLLWIMLHSCLWVGGNGYPGYGIYNADTGIVLCMVSANKILRYNITSSLIVWTHTQNDRCNMMLH